MTAAPAQIAQRDLKVAEVAAILRVNPGKVLGWIHGGQLAAVDVSADTGVGRPRWRVSPADLARFRASRLSDFRPAPPRRRRRNPKKMRFFTELKA